MNTNKRIELVKAMEMLARAVNAQATDSTNAVQRRYF